MNKLFFFTILFFIGLGHELQAYQDDKVIAWINEKPISASEFLYAFNKNRNSTASIDQDSLSNYLDQYLNFKLKVLAAKREGIDTTAKFLEEYEAYTSEIKKPYLQNPNLEEDLILEAYERLNSEIRAAHILVRLPKNPSPKDTLLAYQKIDEVRNRVLKGEDFAELARKNSSDGTAKLGGDLGYFTGFSMVYPFEVAAYSTPVGQVSKITRTQFGYHLVKVLDKRAARGRVKTAHIFVNVSNRSDDQAKEIIQTVYDSLENGGDWRALCATYSEDTRSKMSGGTLPFYGVTQFPEPLLDAAFKLGKINDYTKPVKSRFGWHILKLDAKEPIKPLNQLRGDISERVKRSGRNQLDKKGILNKLKKENGFKAYQDTIQYTVQQISVPDSLKVKLGNYPLIEVGKKTFNNVDFRTFVAERMKTNRNFSEGEIWKWYEEWEFEKVSSFEDEQIPTKYPNHQFLLNEYRDGLLLFEIMEREIWNKALADSIGLNTFFEKNQKEYPVNERAEVISIESDSGLVLNQIVSLIAEQNSIFNLQELIKTNLSEATYGLLKIVKRHYEQSESPIFAGNPWESGSLIKDLEHSKLYWIERIVPKGYFTLVEIKGLVISDYQDELEKQWVQRLRKENKIRINKKLLKALPTKIEED